MSRCCPATGESGRTVQGVELRMGDWRRRGFGPARRGDTWASFRATPPSTSPRLPREAFVLGHLQCLFAGHHSPPAVAALAAPDDAILRPPGVVDGQMMAPAMAAHDAMPCRNLLCPWGEETVIGLHRLDLLNGTRLTSFDAYAPVTTSMLRVRQHHRGTWPHPQGEEQQGCPRLVHRCTIPGQRGRGQGRSLVLHSGGA